MDLLALLKWKAFPDRIMDILGRLRHVSGEEIVKVWLPQFTRAAGGRVWAKALTALSFCQEASQTVPQNIWLDE